MSENNKVQHAEFTRSGVQGSISDIARITAKAIKGIVGADSVERRAKDVYVIKKNYIEWKLFPPGTFDDQYPRHWRITVEALNNEHNHTSPNQQKMFEDDLKQIITILIRYH